MKLHLSKSEVKDLLKYLDQGYRTLSMFNDTTDKDYERCESIYTQINEQLELEEETEE